MPKPIEELKTEVDRALAAGNPADAVCYLAEIVATHPDDRHTRLALGVALGDAGFPTGALKVIRALADRLAHQGFLLPAMIVVRQGLERAGNDPSLLSTLKRLHVRGVRAKAGNLPTPPPLKPRKPAAEAATAEALLALEGQTRLERATEAGCEFPPAGEQAIPLPMPLFCELDEESFVETVKRLRYQRLGKGSILLEEGARGDTLLIVASGHVNVAKGGTQLAKLGPGNVIGEMALLTGAPRSATVTAEEEVEIFELSRQDVGQLAQSRPKVAEELTDYCRKRLIGNLLRTSPMFTQFDESTRYVLLDKFQRRGFQPGEKLIEQGHPGTGLFVLATGEVEVTVAKEGAESVTVANLGPGEVVGEISLLHHQETNATVTARERTGALFLGRDDFQAVLDENPSVRTYLEGLSQDRLEASKAATDAEEVIDADDLIVL
jgi:CRP-like cAMP-binding protein